MRLLHRCGLPRLVATLCFAVFIPSLDGQFLNWDDQVNFVSNPGYRGLGLQQIRRMLTSTLTGHWMPLTWLSCGPAQRPTLGEAGANHHGPAETLCGLRGPALLRQASPTLFHASA